MIIMAGPGNTSLAIQSTSLSDSGEYECRIMVSQPLSVTHTLLVTSEFSLQTQPREGVVMAALRSDTTIGCRAIGEQGGNTSIVWTREGERFRDGSYSAEGDTITLESLEIKDAGYYYCSATGPEGQTKTSSIQVQVNNSTILTILTTMVFATQLCNCRLHMNF